VNADRLPEPPDHEIEHMNANVDQHAASAAVAFERRQPTAQGQLKFTPSANENDRTGPRDFAASMSRIVRVAGKNAGHRALSPFFPATRTIRDMLAAKSWVPSDRFSFAEG